jgi:addiction module HigA family antidote
MYFDSLEVTVTEAAKRLGVPRQSLSELLNGHNGVSADMAIRLAKAFPNTNIRFWLGLQLQYDVWQAERRAPLIDVERFPTPEAPAT